MNTTATSINIAKFFIHIKNFYSSMEEKILLNSNVPTIFIKTLKKIPDRSVRKGRHFILASSLVVVSYFSKRLTENFLRKYYVDKDVVKH